MVWYSICMLTFLYHAPVKTLQSCALPTLSQRLETLRLHRKGSDQKTQFIVSYAQWNQYWLTISSHTQHSVRFRIEYLTKSDLNFVWLVEWKQKNQNSHAAHCAKFIISKCSVSKNKHQCTMQWMQSSEVIFLSMIAIFLYETFQENLSGAEECNIGCLGKLKYLERSPRESNRILRIPHMGRPDQLNQKLVHVVFSLRSPEGGSTVCFWKKRGKYAGRHLRKRMFFLSRLFVSTV